MHADILIMYALHCLKDNNLQASSEFRKPRAPGHEFGIKNNFIPYGDTSEKAVPVEFDPIFLV